MISDKNKKQKQMGNKFRWLESYKVLKVEGFGVLVNRFL